MYLVIFPIFLLSNYTRNGQSDKYSKCCLYPIFGNFFCCNSLKNGDIIMSLMYNLLYIKDKMRPKHKCKV